MMLVVGDLFRRLKPWKRSNLLHGAEYMTKGTISTPQDPGHSEPRQTAQPGPGRASERLCDLGPVTDPADTDYRFEIRRSSSEGCWEGDMV